MDYEQKYEEALERAKVVSPGTTNYNIVTAIFPELKESKDEEVRKHLISFLKDIMDFGKDVDFNKYYKSDCAGWIAWLEKQGEHKKFLKTIQVGDEITKNERGQLVNLSQLERVAKPRNKQKGKQKPADKVEPKFRSGDFITDGERIFQIEKTVWERNNRNDGITYCESLIVNLRDGYTYADNTDLKKYHLWTIQDVKDGDVLVTHLSPEGDWIGMYKESTGDTFKTHCYLSAVGEFVINPNRCKNHGTYGLHPATKEQRDILFQEMKEAGYEWDAEKKELKKIEQKPEELPRGEDYAIDGLWQAIQILEHSLGEVDGWQLDDGILEHKCAIEAVKRLYKQKPTWSEEDERMLDRLIKHFDWGSDYRFDKNDCNEAQNWLKSLKERMKG